MRLSITLAIAIWIGVAGIGFAAQDIGMRPLAGQILEQELAVERSPGKNDANAWLKLAMLRQDAARYQESERAYRRAIALLKSGDRARLAYALDNLGTMYAECGQFSKAAPLERKALAIRERENDMIATGISHTHLAVLLLGTHDLSAAQKEAELAVSLLVRADVRVEDQMSALIAISLVRCARASCDTAVPDLRRALQIARTGYATDRVSVGFLNFLLGYALWKSGDSDSAGELMRKGTQELSSQIGWDHPTYVQALRQYKLYLTQTGQTREAEEVRLRIAKLENTSPWIAQRTTLQFP